MVMPGEQQGHSLGTSWGLLAGAQLRTESVEQQSAQLSLTPRSPALRRLRETMIFESNLGYIAISRLAWAT